jgi:HAD superfamily hydrolase (TIGR01509 family)
MKFTGRMVKAIIFDIGGVILDMSLLTSQAITVFNPDNPKEFSRELSIETVRACRGEISLFEAFKNMAKKRSKNIPDKLLKELWIKDFEKSIPINEATKQIILSLKKSYKLGIISNIVDEHAKVILNSESYRELFKLFDFIIFSNEVKKTKDRKDIFLLASKKAGVSPEECVFTDDIPEFVEVSKSIGMKGIVFKTAEQFKKDLKKLGVKV